MAKAIMVQGTMSSAGKSFLAAGLCRIFMQDGYKTAPFKSQNMALNSYITKEGLEMGRAQAVQAEAAGILPAADMNPILLKPCSDTGSQVIVRGIPRGVMAAREYFLRKKELIPVILESYRRLDAAYDVIVIEGAGSPAEINLKQDDIVNMGLARLLGAPVILAGDIDRGGVFAQLYGTTALLSEEERAMVKGLVINKFRGDPAILAPGVAMLEELTGIPVMGVVPYMDVDLEDEDSLSGRLSGGGERDAAAAVDIAVIRFPRISNFTDFHVFSTIQGVCVRYVERAADLKSPDLILLPGTKNTVEDLLWMRENGLEAAVLKEASRETPIWGICGGHQMMGGRLEDEDGAESGGAGRTLGGMGLFPCSTHFRPEKTRTRVRGRFGDVRGIFSGLSGMAVEGYEIHMGQTVYTESETENARPLVRIAEYEAGGPAGGRREDPRGADTPEGICRENLYGTYLHGIFDAPGVAGELVNALLKRKGYNASLSAGCALDYRAYRGMQYDRLAMSLRKHLDMDAVYRIMGLARRGAAQPGKGQSI